MSSKVFFQSVIVNFWRLEQRAPSGFGVLPSTSQGWLERPGSLTQLRGMRYNIETSEILSWIVMVALIIAYTKQAQRYIPTCCRNSPGLMLTLALALFIYHEILILDVTSQENQRQKNMQSAKKISLSSAFSTCLPSEGISMREPQRGNVLKWTKYIYMEK